MLNVTAVSFIMTVFSNLMLGLLFLCSTWLVDDSFCSMSLRNSNRLRSGYMSSGLTYVTVNKNELYFHHHYRMNIMIRRTCNMFWHTNKIETCWTWKASHYLVDGRYQHIACFCYPGRIFCSERPKTFTVDDDNDNDEANKLGWLIREIWPFHKPRLQAHIQVL